MSRLIGVYGAGGAGRGVLPLLRQRQTGDRLVFIDDRSKGGKINGHDTLTWEQFERAKAHKSVAIAIANSRVRQNLHKKCTDVGIDLIHVQADNVVIMDDVLIAEGAILSPFVTITSNIRIGKCFQANLYSYVEHDCTIGDFVTFAPGAKCNGNVEIHDHVYIGSNAVIRHGTSSKPMIIGEGAIVGMGAVVTKDVPAGATVVGNPAREIGQVS